MRLDYTGEMLEELQRCFHNPDHFIENYLEVEPAEIDPDTQHTQDKSFTTEQLCAYVVWYATFHIGTLTIMVSPTVVDRVAANKLVRVMFDKVPQFMRHEYKECNRQQIRFSTETKILFAVASEYVFRGMTTNLAVFEQYYRLSAKRREAMMLGCGPVLMAHSNTIIAGEEESMCW